MAFHEVCVKVTVFKLMDKERSISDVFQPLTGQDGNYLGRSTQLPSLMPRLGGINGKSQGSISLRDSGDSIVLDACLHYSPFSILISMIL